eukprot:2660599-Pyramimonas_sp.AAC.1
MQGENEECQSNGGLTLVGVTLAFLRDFRDNHPGIEGLTTEQVCRTIVEPETKALECTYTTLLLNKGKHEHVGRATVFVSHAWECAFAKLLEVLLQLQAEHEAAGEPPPLVWVDIF